MKGYIYILKDSEGKFYIDNTTDVNGRLKQHLGGNTHTTARIKKPVLVFVQKYDLLNQARVIERKLKKLKRKDYIEKISNDGKIQIII